MMSKKNELKKFLNNFSNQSFKIGKLKIGVFDSEEFEQEYLQELFRSLGEYKMEYPDRLTDIEEFTIELMDFGILSINFANKEISFKELESSITAEFKEFMICFFKNYYNKVLASLDKIMYGYMGLKTIIKVDKN